ncbi:signal peptidase II [Candidatus Babeliales bacterium]|nr:signal peptidase II [Candidatus Babeliales bacterium]MCF7899399.1 signal peptidase II [Candidatus Babeliales bacterium]
MKKNNLIFYYFRIFFAIFLVDRLTKLWALKNLVVTKIKLGSVLNLRLVFNRGVVWGLFGSSEKLGFIILTAIISFIIIFFSIYTFFEYRKKDNIFFNVLILAGAFSNLLDRFIYASVIDFIDLHIKSWHWPVFNFADLFIFVGVVGVLGRYWYGNFKKT